MARSWLPLAVGLLVLPVSASAHGVRTRVSAGDTTVVTVVHEDGAPLAGATFAVQAPGESRSYCRGTTDAQGRLSFHADRPGNWRVRVSTADGHGTVVTVAIAPDAVATPPSGASPTATPPTAAPARSGTTPEAPASAAPSSPPVPPSSAPVGGARLLRALAGGLALVSVFALGARLWRGRRADRPR